MIDLCKTINLFSFLFKFATLGHSGRHRQENATVRLHFGANRDSVRSRGRLVPKSVRPDEGRHRGQRARSSHRYDSQWSIAGRRLYL
jgi:hypothetical protein